MKLTRWMMFVLAVPMIGVVGCHAPSGDMADMQMPTRPAELDRLSMFIGNWNSTMKMKMGGSEDVIESKGSGSYKWVLDKKCMIDHFEADMGEGKTMKGMGLWVWDPRANKYRSKWYDNWGGVGEGTVTYNEKSRKWHINARSTNAYMGMSTVGNGDMIFTDDNTIEWTWNEWIPFTFRLIKVMEMEGTSVRQ